VIRKLYLFIDNLNAEKMLKIYQKALIPSAPNAGLSVKIKIKIGYFRRIMSPNIEARSTDFRKREIETLHWPSQSPDANPIENIWLLIKRKLRGRPTSTSK